MSLYPFGYAGNPQGMGTMLTWGQYLTKQTVWRLHPEFLRRVKALMEAAAAEGVPLGIGGGWRVQPNPPPPGFARPGNSNHEGFPVGPDSTGAVAADMVPNVSWPWMEANVARFGLRTFKHVNNEPWHIQPAEIPANRNWRTQPWTLATFPLPGDVSPPPVVPLKPPTGGKLVTNLVNVRNSAGQLCWAVFVGQFDERGIATHLEWCGPGGSNAAARIDRYSVAGVPTTTLSLDQVKSLSVDRVPQGDAMHPWSENDFASVG